MDTAHDGNVHEASQVAGVAYATLRDLYTGKSTNPSLRTLQQLAKAYGIYPNWFTDSGQPASVPAGGFMLRVPGYAYGPTPQTEREAMIPHAAFPFARVYVRLDEMLDRMPPSPSRPIVGETNNDRHWHLAVGEFLFGPLLETERRFHAQVIPDAAPWSRDRWDDPDVLWPYVRVLKDLGRSWETTMDRVLAELHSPTEKLPAVARAE